MPPLITPDWATQPNPENHIIPWCTQRGIKIVTNLALPGNKWGGYDQTTNSIYVTRGLPLSWLHATIGHETWHVANGHNGHQAANVEARINRDLARVLIDRGEYAFWEREYGGSIAGIAHQLEVPVWLVAAYKDFLKSF